MITIGGVLKDKKPYFIYNIVVESAKLVVEYDGAAFHGTHAYGSEQKMKVDKVYIIIIYSII